MPERKQGWCYRAARVDSQDTKKGAPSEAESGKRAQGAAAVP